MKSVFSGILKSNASAAVEEIYSAVSNSSSKGSKEYGHLARTVDELVPKESGVKIVAKYCFLLAMQHGGATREMVRVVRDKLRLKDNRGSGSGGDYSYAEHMASVVVCCGSRQASEEIDDMAETFDRGWGQFGKDMANVRDRMIMMAD